MARRIVEMIPSPPRDGAAPTRRARLALALGALLGLTLAITAILRRSGDSPFPPDAVATVNERAIRAEDLERAIRALEADRRDPVDADERRFVLDRLVDEELLVQRARELGLDQFDPGVRGRLASAMMEAVLAETEDGDPSDEEVEKFYQENRGFFAGVQRLAVRALRVEITRTRPEAEARAIALQAAARLRGGEVFERVDRDLGDPPIAPLPQGLLHPEKLREYLGPTASEVALGLALGGVSDPVRNGEEFLILQLVERTDPTSLPLDAIAKQVRAEIRRRSDEQRLRAYLDELRAQAKVQVRQP